jgi:hypothetical protein
MFAPDALSVTGEPVHTGLLLEAKTAGDGITVTIIVAEAVHPFTSVAVTVYVVVESGVAITVVPVVALKPVAGLQA